MSRVCNGFLAGLLAIGMWLFGPTAAPAATIDEQTAYEIGVEAYIYFYPLITMDVTRLQFTNSNPERCRAAVR